MIRVKEVAVIGDDGEQMGIFLTEDAINMAQDRNLDLVEVAPTANPPVCRIMDFGKFKYRQSKKTHEAKKNQKIVHLKEVKFRPNTDQHDYNFKLKHITRFIEAGDKAKVVIFFKGREIVHRENGFRLLDRIIADIEEIALVESSAKQEGRTLVMILAPNAKRKGQSGTKTNTTESSREINAQNKDK